MDNIDEENVVNENNENKRKNRKRKKSFLQNARKYAKKGTFGRGSHLTEDIYQYFVNVLELLRNGFENDEEKEIFVNNVFEQTCNEEVNYSRNQIGCRVIESLLPFANDEVLQRYYEAFNDDLRPLLSDRFASHVIQMLVKIAAFKGAAYTPDQKDTIVESSFNFAQKISKFLLNNLEDFIWDTYANHIIRTVLQSLSGIFENSDNKQKNSIDNLKNFEKSQLLPEFTEIVKEYGERLIQWPQFIDLPYEEINSGLLQILLIALRKIDSKLQKRILKKLLEDSFLGDEYKNNVLENQNPEQTIFEKRLPPVFESEPAIRLLEVSILNAKSKMFTQIYAKCFVSNLAQLAKLKNTNFTVQKLINTCSEKVEFEAIYDELSPEIENIFLTGHTGVILSLAQACKRLSTRQGNFIQQFMQSLHCNEPAEKQNSIVPLALRMVPLERLEKVVQNQIFNVSLHGSIIIQTLLDFNKPIKVVNSLLNMDLEELKKLFCDSKGCHIMDSYMSSQFVGEKSREKLIRKLQGIHQDLASTKYGSRSFDALWAKTNIKQKYYIMDELCHKEAGWSNSEFGKIIASKLNILLYRRNKEQWATSLSKSDKTKDLFADIIGDVK